MFPLTDWATHFGVPNYFDSHSQIGEFFRGADAPKSRDHRGVLPAEADPAGGGGEQGGSALAKSRRGSQKGRATATHEVLGGVMGSWGHI